MCGRTACALAPDQICRAARYRNANGKWVQPRWRDPPGGQKYYGSYNIAPTSHTPVMLSKKLLAGSRQWKDDSSSNQDEASDYIIQPMLWGLVPSWHKGDPKTVAYKMNNARSDGMLQKKSFKGPLEKGRRCVVLVEGYYEWHTAENGKKQPYFISIPTVTDTKQHILKQDFKQEIKREPIDEDFKKEVDSDGKGQSIKQEIKPNIKQEPVDGDVNAEVKQNFTTEVKTENKEEFQKDMKAESVFDSQFDEDGPPKRLLAMAGIFDVWHPKDEDDPLYSYSIITVDADKSVSFIHHRMPAILNGEEEIKAWLDFESVPLSKAVTLIHGKDCLSFYPVSQSVNKVQNKSEECIKPVDLSKPKESKSSIFMAGWLAKAKTSSPEKHNVRVPEIKKEIKTLPEKSPKKENMIINWLKNAKSPHKNEKENGEPPVKRLKPS